MMHQIRQLILKMEGGNKPDLQDVNGLIVALGGIPLRPDAEIGEHLLYIQLLFARLPR